MSFLSRFKPNHSLKYNSNIDGLRGIAVSLVVLFHIWPEYFSFGYVGVDIFFVLSGFLITKIIHKKLNNDNFSLLEFYRNRIRRILPASLIVLLFAFVVGYIYLFPSEFKRLGKHLKSSALFYQNIRLNSEVGYWDTAAHLKPLLHYWSLAVEEQFYLFWPFVMLAMHKLKIRIFPAILTILSCFILYAFFYGNGEFYNSFIRFWEILVGAFVYSISIKWKIEEKNKGYFVSVFLFILCILLSKGNSEYNFWKTFLVVCSSGILIVFLNVKQKSLFSSKILVALGLLSYSLYLWHYVLIGYVNLLNIGNYFSGFFILLLSFVLSLGSYLFIELPCRSKSSYKFATCILLATILMGIVGECIKENKGFPNRNHLFITNKTWQGQFERGSSENKNGVEVVSHLLQRKGEMSFQKATTNDVTKPFIVVIGDSHANAAYKGIARESRERDYDVLMLGNSGTPPFVGGVLGSVRKQKHVDEIYEVLENLPNIEKIIFISRGPKYMYGIEYEDAERSLIHETQIPANIFKRIPGESLEERFLDALDQTFAFFAKNKKIDFYFLLENPELGFEPETCLDRPFLKSSVDCRVGVNNYRKRIQKYRQGVQDIAAKYPMITIIDVTKAFCDMEYCYATKDGKMLYVDDHHLSDDGSFLQAQEIYKILEE